MKRVERILTAVAILLAGSVTLGQTDPKAALQEKLAAVKQAAAENKQKLQQYTWIETTQLTLKGIRNLRRRIAADTAQTGRFKKLPSVLPRNNRVAGG